MAIFWVWLVIRLTYPCSCQVITTNPPVSCLEVTLHSSHPGFAATALISTGRLGSLWLELCLPSGLPKASSCTLPPSGQLDLSRVYHNFLDAFSSGKGHFLPSHRLYDCAINLLPSPSLPKGCLYSLPGFGERSYGDIIYQRFPGCWHHQTVVVPGYLRVPGNALWCDQHPCGVSSVGK